MQCTVPRFWDSVGDGALHSSYVGTAAKSGTARFISVEPNSLNGDLEWHTGTAWERFLADESFRGIDKVVRELTRVCEIKTLARAGLLACTRFRRH